LPGNARPTAVSAVACRNLRLVTIEKDPFTE
jgi:hypothetical protein